MVVVACVPFLSYSAGRGRERSVKAIKAIAAFEEK